MTATSTGARWSRLTGGDQPGRRPELPDWPTYLADFHAGRPGVGEELLARCRSGTGELTPYGWVTRAVGTRPGRILTLACGSAPVLAMLAAGADRPDLVAVAASDGPAAAGSRDVPTRAPAHRLLVGLDVSAAELAVARARGRGPLVRADARALPFAARSFDAVAASMALMVVQPVDVVLGELARVVRPGGLLAATVATAYPLRSADVPLLTGLTGRLRSTPQFPAGGELVGLRRHVGAAGFQVLEDARERFGFRVCDSDDATLLVEALYLPGTTPRRRALAAGWLAARAARTPGGVEVAIPVRRLVAMREPAGAGDRLLGS